MTTGQQIPIIPLNEATTWRYHMGDGAHLVYTNVHYWHQDEKTKMLTMFDGRQKILGGVDMRECLSYKIERP